MITGKHKAAMAALEEELARKDSALVNEQSVNKRLNKTIGELTARLAESAKAMDDAVADEMIKRLNAEAALAQMQNEAFVQAEKQVKVNPIDNILTTNAP